MISEINKISWNDQSPFRSWNTSLSSRLKSYPDPVPRGFLIEKPPFVHDKYFQLENVQVSGWLKVENRKWRSSNRTQRTVAVGVEKGRRTWGGIEGRSVNIKRRGENLREYIVLISLTERSWNSLFDFQLDFLWGNSKDFLI